MVLIVMTLVVVVVVVAQQPNVGHGRLILEDSRSQ
jgi:hypothetical protein